jgi:hypothetical protein
MARSRPVASPTKTAAEDSSRPLRTRRQPCGGGTPWHLAGLGSFPGGIPASSARRPAEDAAEAVTRCVTRIEAVAIDGRVNVGRPAHASGGTAWDLLPCRGRPHASTYCFIHAMERSVTVTRRIRCAACKEVATPNKLCVAIHGTGSLYLRRSRSYRAHTDLPVWTGSPRLGPRCIATRSSRWHRQWQSADSDDRRKLQARRSHRDLRTTRGGPKMQRRPQVPYSIRCDASPDVAAQRLGRKCGPRVR